MGAFAIAGAGPGGLAAAILLRRAGHDVSVFERAPALRLGGGALALWPHGTRALATLLGEAATRALGPTYDRARIRRWDGALVHDLPIAAHAAHYGGWLMAVDRGGLIAALGAAAGQVTFGREVVGFERRAHEVNVSFADGAHADFEALIGADGFGSNVRNALGAEGTERPAGMTAWLGASASRATGPRCTTTFEGQGRRFLHLPHPGGAWWYAYTHDSLGVADARTLRHAFRHFPALVVDTIEDTPSDSLLRFSLRDRPPDDVWGQGRVTLLGDAAHACTPDLGQGVCMALEDAIALGNHLTDGPDVELQLRAYEAERRPRTAGLQRASWAISQASFAGSDIACQLRDAAFAAAPDAALLAAFGAMFSAPQAGTGTTEPK